MFLILYALLAIFLIFVLVLLYGSHRAILDKRYRLPPGPKPLPFIGCAYLFADENKKPWQELAKQEKQFGPVYTYYIGQVRVIHLSDPAIIRQFLVTNAKWYSNRADPILPGYNSGAYPYGVIAHDGESWTHLRRFCQKALRDFGMLEKVQEEASCLLSELDSHLKKPTRLNTLFTNAVSNVICSTVFGKRFDYGDKKFLDLLHITEIFFTRPFKVNAIYLGIPFLARFFYPPQASDLGEVSKAVAKTVESVLEDHRHDFNPDNIRDFIDLYIQDSKTDATLSWESFVGTMKDLFLAGTETTASAVNWTILYFCKWPHIQAKCQQVIDKVIATDRLPSLTDRPSLVYVDAVMNEVLRHVTIVPTALFHATKNEMLKYEEWDIPPNTVINYNVWAVHYDETYWKDPEEFRPERWIDSNDGSLLSHATHFMPFGIGPRICLGDQLAKLEYFIFVAAMLQRFSFSFPENYDVDINTGRHNVTHVPPDFEVIVKRRNFH